MKITVVTSVLGICGLLGCGVQSPDDETISSDVTMEAAAQEVAAGAAPAATRHWATLFSDAGGGGLVFNVVGTSPCGGDRIANLPNFNDVTSSVQVLVPGCFIVLFEHNDGQGTRVRFDFAGGAVQNVPSSFNDKASSFL